MLGNLVPARSSSEATTDLVSVPARSPLVDRWAVPVALIAIAVLALQTTFANLPATKIFVGHDTGFYNLIPQQLLRTSSGAWEVKMDFGIPNLQALFSLPYALLVAALGALHLSGPRDRARVLFLRDPGARVRLLRAGMDPRAPRLPEAPRIDRRARRDRRFAVRVVQRLHRGAAALSALDVPVRRRRVAGRARRGVRRAVVSSHDRRGHPVRPALRGVDDGQPRAHAARPRLDRRDRRRQRRADRRVAVAPGDRRRGDDVRGARVHLAPGDRHHADVQRPARRIRRRRHRRALPLRSARRAAHLVRELGPLRRAAVVARDAQLRALRRFRDDAPHRRTGGARVLRAARARADRALAVDRRRSRAVPREGDPPAAPDRHDPARDARPAVDRVPRSLRQVRPGAAPRAAAARGDRHGGARRFAATPRSLAVRGGARVHRRGGLAVLRGTRRRAVVSHDRSGGLPEGRRAARLGFARALAPRRAGQRLHPQVVQGREHRESAVPLAHRQRGGIQRAADQRVDAVRRRRRRAGDGASASRRRARTLRHRPRAAAQGLPHQLPDGVGLSAVQSARPADRDGDAAAARPRSAARKAVRRTRSRAVSHQAAIHARPRVRQRRRDARRRLRRRDAAVRRRRDDRRPARAASALPRKSGDAARPRRPPSG